MSSVGGIRQIPVNKGFAQFFQGCIAALSGSHANAENSFSQFRIPVRARRSPQQRKIEGAVHSAASVFAVREEGKATLSGSRYAKDKVAGEVIMECLHFSIDSADLLVAAQVADGVCQRSPEAQVGYTSIVGGRQPGDGSGEMQSRGTFKQGSSDIHGHAVEGNPIGQTAAQAAVQLLSLKGDYASSVQINRPGQNAFYPGVAAGLYALAFRFLLVEKYKSGRSREKFLALYLIKAGENRQVGIIKLDAHQIVFQNIGAITGYAGVRRHSGKAETGFGRFAEFQRGVAHGRNIHLCQYIGALMAPTGVLLSSYPAGNYLAVDVFCLHPGRISRPVPKGEFCHAFALVGGGIE